MRLAGYDLRLVSHADWLAALDRDTLRRPPIHSGPFVPSSWIGWRAPGLTLPELFEEGRRTTATAAKTDVWLQSVVERPRSAPLLDCYFTAYRASGLPPPRRMRGTSEAPAVPAFDAAFFEAALSAGVRVRSATLLSSGSEFSIISELHDVAVNGQPAGLFRYRWSSRRTADRAPRSWWSK
jgi:hypothetical protein